METPDVCVPFRARTDDEELVEARNDGKKEEMSNKVDKEKVDGRQRKSRSSSI